MRTIHYLTTNWKFVASFQPNYTRVGLSASAEEVDIPHQPWILPEHHIRSTDLEGEFTYAKRIRKPEVIEGDYIFLRFEGVQAKAEIYVEGELVLTHLGGYLPFQVNLTSAFNKQEELLVVVRVDTQEDPSFPPFGHVIDYLTYGGIYREVSLVTLNLAHMDNIKVTTPDLQTIHVKTFLTFRLSPTTQFIVTVRDVDGETILREEQVARPGDNEVTLTSPQLLPWTLEKPTLYTVTLELFQDSILKDYENINIGLRTIQFTPSGFYLNGERVFLRGLNRHQSYPYVGDAMPRALQREDARILKEELAVNMVRTSHYPQSRHFLDACDELGLLVMEEIPGWQHIGDDAWQQTAIQHVKDMIDRDRHHPSIILWGVRINESPDHHDFYTLTNQVAHEADPTRPTGGVRNFKDSEFLEDVYTYNDFSHTGENAGVLPPRQVMKKEVPFLVTEYNGHMFPTRINDGEEQLTAHALRHFNVIKDAAASPQHAGALGWCMNDYPTHEQFGHSDRVCYHGVLTAHRIPKLAASAYKIHQTNTPVLDVSTTYNPGAHPGAVLGDFYVFTNCETVELYKGADLLDRYMVTDGLLHITDLIGNLLVTKEQVSTKDNDTLKNLLWAVSENGIDGLSIGQKLSMLNLMKKYKWSQADAARLFTTYIGNWGSETTKLRLKGYRNGVMVKEVIIGPKYPSHLEFTCSHPLIVEKDTYEIVRLTVSLVDEDSQPLVEAREVVQLSLKGPGQIVGPSAKALVGGSTAFYIRTIHKAGTIRYALMCDQTYQGNGSIEVQIAESN